MGAAVMGRVLIFAHTLPAGWVSWFLAAVVVAVGVAVVAVMPARNPRNIGAWIGPSTSPILLGGVAPRVVPLIVWEGVSV